MAVDYIIASVLIISAIINALALGAFWVTPSLRTTANRFVINLLIVNLVGCAVLIPSLFVCGNSIDNIVDALPARSIVEKIITENVTIEDRIECANRTVDGRNCSGWIIENEKKIVIQEIAESFDSGDMDASKVVGRQRTRCWGFDLATALGSLSVLLVVGDTWCAVTDPLRYHTRVSELKAWIFIAATWFVSILFGIASAFRNEMFWYGVGSTITNFTVTSAPSNSNGYRVNDNLLNFIFSCTYFVVIILLPIGLVCAMYWKIFTEARQNGLRMRQNGSSPLLQSALNLAAASTVVHQNCANGTGGASAGLTMKIDKNIPKSTTPPTSTRRYLEIPKTNTKDKNQNVLMTFVQPIQTTDQQMRRNCSARHLMLLEQQSGTMNGTSLRHVHSTPNLQKSHDQQLNHNIAVPTSSHIPPKALGYMTSIRHRLSNASSIFKYREESRAARISILVVIMFLVSYFPYGLLILLQERVIFIDSSSVLPVCFVVVANLSSPFIFAYRNKRVRRGVCRLFGIDAKTNERLQRHRKSLHQSKANVQRSVSKASTFSLRRNQLVCKSNGSTPVIVSKGQTDIECLGSHYISAKDSDRTEKFSLLKKVCNSSRKWGCTRHSSTSDNFPDPTHV
ncbi:uncharacterized protein LOC119074334 [Bradysia coprophila]|uniref:uncharacterized protein LOC119074334 n=1 Tax=Bradysia coprophila TaxID=38358 RepID=UPI00187D8A04|nr:uncharacterized protein LOC119074334 [Bradysia coprophila]XP_037036316.1 uncharacterized protein LOC119074334 [Bradysia coprophila]XP_037036317.1 uncharacterized protein LOC119074334 [Bradysia coprophila]